MDSFKWDSKIRAIQFPKTKYTHNMVFKVFISFKKGWFKNIYIYFISFELFFSLFKLLLYLFGHFVIILSILFNLKKNDSSNT